MSLYSFQLNGNSHSKPSNGPRSILLSSPIPAESFYARIPLTSSSMPLQPRIVDVNNQASTPISSVPTTPEISLHPSSPQKRKRDLENADVFNNYTPDAPHARKKRKKPGMSPLEKLESVLKHIQGLRWSYSDYLYWSSEWKNFSRGSAHSHAIENFLSGRCDHHPGEIIRNWYTSPDGRPGDSAKAKMQMWSTGSPKYWKITNIRACLTSFVAQTCISEVVKQARHAVKPTGGLHVRLSVKSNSGSTKNPVQSEWKDISADTVSRVGDIIRTKQPFLYDILSCVVSGKSAGHSIEVRKTRPIDISAPVDLFAYESRIGTMPSYSTIYGILRELGHAEGLATKLAGMNPRYWGKIVIDNVQNYLRQRDMRVGRENKMT
ncbi:hypothetical protein F5877DRAFT_73579, partial [Lentinula edodes]